jgi:hypothetical protein
VGVQGPGRCWEAQGQRVMRAASHSHLDSLCILDAQHPHLATPQHEAHAVVVGGEGRDNVDAGGAPGGSRAGGAGRVRGGGAILQSVWRQRGQLGSEFCASHAWQRIFKQQRGAPPAAGQCPPARPKPLTQTLNPNPPHLALPRSMAREQSSRVTSSRSAPRPMATAATGEKAGDSEGGGREGPAGVAVEASARLKVLACASAGAGASTLGSAQRASRGGREGQPVSLPAPLLPSDLTLEPCSHPQQQRPPLL